MNGSVVLASGVEASRVGIGRCPAAASRRAWSSRRRRRRAWRRPGRPCRAAIGTGLASDDRQRHAGPVEALDRAQAPGQVLAALVGQLRGARERHARFQRVGQQHAGSGSACSL